MAPLKHALAIYLLIGIAFGLPQDNKKLESIIESILKDDCAKGDTSACAAMQTQPVTEPPADTYKTCENNGICVPKDLCKSNEVITTGEGIFKERTDANVCDSTEICCGKENKNKIEPVVTSQVGGNQDTATYTPCGNQGMCVPRFLCRSNQIVTNGVDIFEERMDRLGCKGFEVCCGASNVTNTTTGTTITTTTMPSSVKERTGCGYRNPTGVGARIATGAKVIEAEFGEFPWMVAILTGAAETYLCGGALIAPTVIITAAHCVKNSVANDLTVRAGEWDTQSKIELYPDQSRKVNQIISHESFNRASLYNDIALLIVESPFVYEEHVQSICLPPPGTNFDHTRCYATGWGKDKFGKEGTLQVVLKKVDLPIVPSDKCQKDLRKTRLGKLYNLHDSFICAGGELGKDTCEGDGGSPLVCPIAGADDRFYHAGIVAYGLECGKENVPAVYANVAHLRAWINEKMTQLGIEFSHFTA